jgi:hypothetical protein
MDIARHAAAQVANGPAPALDQLRKGAMVVLGLDPPHGLFIRHRKQQGQSGKRFSIHASADPNVAFIDLFRAGSNYCSGRASRSIGDTCETRFPSEKVSKHLKAAG